MSAFVQCDHCSNEADVSLCNDCSEQDSAAGQVRDWLAKERLKPASDVTSDAIRIIERMAEDLEVGDGR